MDVIQIVGVIALLAVTVLCVYIITVLVRIRKLLDIVETDIKEFSSRALPIFHNLEIITDKVRRVTESVDEQIEMVKSSIQSMKEIADNIVDFEKRVQERIEEPVMESIGVVAAVFKGVRAFFARLRE
jgi:uncharacterized protein YoxC